MTKKAPRGRGPGSLGELLIQLWQTTWPPNSPGRLARLALAGILLIVAVITSGWYFLVPEAAKMMLIQRSFQKGKTVGPVSDPREDRQPAHVDVPERVSAPRRSPSVGEHRKAVSGEGAADVTKEADGSWTVRVPVREEGTPVVDGKGNRLLVSPGDRLHLAVSGTVDIGRGAIGPDGESDYTDHTMDGPFKDHVGGLEMWIGPDKEANRYMVGSQEWIDVAHSGDVTFRVIESKHGYHDGNNSGAFTVNMEGPR